MLARVGVLHASNVERPLQAGQRDSRTSGPQTHQRQQRVDVLGHRPIRCRASACSRSICRVAPLSLGHARSVLNHLKSARGDL